MAADARTFGKARKNGNGDGNGKRRNVTLVTGASGFIGSAVVRKLLERGRRVRCYVEPRADLRNLAGLDVELLEGDVNDREGIERALDGCGVLYHLAAIYRIWMPDPEKIYEVNVEGTKTVLWAALKAGLRRVVYTSSIAAIGAREDGHPADETTPYNLWDESDAYIRSKYLSEREALRFAREGLPLVIVCPSMPFGERDIAPTPTGRLILEVLRRGIAAYPDGGFNCVDVEDVAAAHLLAEERGQVGERYIAGGHNVTYREFYDLVGEAAGLKRRGIELPPRAFRTLGWLFEKHADHVSHRPPPVTYKTALWSTRNVWFDNARARRELSMPVTPLRQTIERAVRWFRENARA